MNLFDVQFDNCTAAAEIASSSALHVLQFFQFFVCLLTILFCLMNMFVRRLSPRPAALHRNLVVIVVTGLAYYFIHSTSIILLQLNHLISYYAAKSPCDLQTKQWMCILLKAPGYATIIGFTTIHCALFLGRAIATMLSHVYETINCRIGYVASALSLVASCAWVASLFSDADFSANISYCMITTGRNADRLQVTDYVLIAVDALVCLGDFYLLKVNKRNVNRRLLGGRRYSLSKSFQLRENRLTIKLIFPMSVIHTVGFMLYLIFAAAARRFSSQMEATDFALLLEVARDLHGNYFVGANTPENEIRARKSLQYR
ncbi:CRE-SRAB-12 protein [Aphelenchoides avenae]|nr:CRE-SRAB-12 protein [Aphelenchus avenae]